jgi:isocitrate lyase
VVEFSKAVSYQEERNFSLACCSRLIDVSLFRPYSAKRIASLRGLLPQTYPSSTMALKLWEQLNKHRDDGTHEMTFGVTDPIIASQMAKYQQTLYVSGALCGFSEVSEPGMDCCDYPLDTVPKVVDKIFKSQVWHSQRQNHYSQSAESEF